MTPSGSSSEQTILTEAFLHWEAQVRERQRRQVDLGAVRKFRRLVRRSGDIWLTRPDRRLRAVRTRDGCGLHFEFRDADQWLSCFVLRAHHHDGLFTLKGPHPERSRMPFGEEARRVFHQLWETWRAWPESEGLGQVAVTAYLHSWSVARLERYALSASQVVSALQDRRGPKAQRRARHVAQVTQRAAKRSAEKAGRSMRKRPGTKPATAKSKRKVKPAKWGK
jgi:hypothetical protein